MADNDKKPLLHVLPALLTGAAALIASLTAVYVNLRHDRDAPPQPVATAQVAPAAAQPAREEAGKPAAPQALRLRVDRIAVRHDGSAGTTDWRFAVEVDGQPLFVFAQDDLDDTGGRNVALPKDADGEVELAPGQAAKVTVKAWRSSRLRMTEGEPDATGEGELRGAGAMAPLEVVAAEPGKGAFVLYFSAAARE